ncbi:hypothetical protein Rhopal_000094-T1 [Rhodotorula paludigena]|uniref:DNA-directed DNA polymerase n=1 Tax=Rhodotorula paludigena TaxID=86838 RepID=A0AAV5GBD4_9BASI|nr:hypothetical protein Rhopal_000094-T1 [Rhodotorula paludigena]
MAMQVDGRSSSSSPPPALATVTNEDEGEVEVVELSPSDGSNAEGLSAPTKSHSRPRRKSTVRADTSTDLRKRLQKRAAAKLPAPAVEQKATAASSARKGAGARGKKPRLSFEQAADEVYNKKTSFANISDYLSHLDEFERDPGAGAKPRVLSGTRIVFVNTDHWRKGGSSAASAAATGPVRNRFDQALRNNMRIAAKHGAVLVKPEDFVPPPFDVGDDNAAALDPQRAEHEQWTTHIIPLELPGHRRTTYAEVLRCLGPSAGGLDEDELGPFVHVVGFDWVSQAVKARARPVESEFAFPGDYRAAARRAEERNEEAARALEKRRKELKRERKKKDEVDKAKARRQGARGRAGDLQEDTEEEEDEDGEGEVADGVSPFGPDDWPPGEAPPEGYFDRISTQTSTGPSLPLRRIQARKLSAKADAADRDADMSDPIDDPDVSRAGPSTTSPQYSPRKGAKRKSPSSSPTGGPSSKKRRGSAGDSDIPHGLEAEFGIIEQHGKAAIDEYLDDPAKFQLQLDDDYMVLSTRPPDDFATDEENSDGEIEGEVFDPKKRKPRDYRWACDDPKGNRVRRDGPNEIAASTLELMADLVPKIRDQDEFRVRSYKQAANKLRAYDTRLDSLPKLTQIRGIGPKLATKIVEIFRTGTHRRVSTFESPEDRALKAFGNVYGIARAMASDLYLKGARTVDDLRRDPDKWKLNEASRIGLKYYEDLLERIPRSEMTAMYERVKEIAQDIDPKLQLECMGSYRRGAESSGDIDFLLTRDPSDGKTHEGMVKKLWRRLVKAGIAHHLLSMPEDWNGLDAKINGLGKLPEGKKMRRIDILGVPWESMPAALIYFTGNDHFNRSIRLKARRHGYRLNQHGLYKDVSRDRKGEKLTEGTLVPGIRTERDIFRVLKVPWSEPEMRIP